MNTDQW